MKKKSIWFWMCIATLSACLLEVNAQWVKTEGIGSDDINALAINGTTLLAGTLYNGMYRSTNGGMNWNEIEGWDAFNSVQALIASNGSIFAGTLGDGIYRSTNNGMSWTPVNSGLTNLSVMTLAASGDNLFAGTYHGHVFFSDNGGNEWTAVDSGLPDTSILSLAVHGDTLFAGTRGHGVYRSVDNGDHWTATDTSIPQDPSIRALAVSDSFIYAGVINGGVYVSTNGGMQWKTINSGLKCDQVETFFIYEGNLFAGTAAGIFCSAIGDTHWVAVNSGVSDWEEFLSLAVYGNDMFAGTSEGVWRRPVSQMVGVDDSLRPPKLSRRVHPELCFSGTTTIPATIAFTLLHPERVTLGVFDVSGNETVCLVDKLLEKGSHAVIWDNRTVPSGLYIVKIRVGVENFTKGFSLFH